MAFLSNNGGESYNLCTFIASFFLRANRSDWSKFEIAGMDFWHIRGILTSWIL